MDWQDLSACLGEDPALFDEFLAKPGAEERKRVIAAKKICAACPVRAECLSFGMSNKESGVRGGEYLSLGRVLNVREPDYRPRRAA